MPLPGPGGGQMPTPDSFDHHYGQSWSRSLHPRTPLLERHPHQKSFLLEGKRRRINGVAIGLNVILPWLLFCASAAIWCSALHYHCLALAAALYALLWLAPLIAIVLMFKARHETMRVPMWYGFCALAMIAALIMGGVGGHANFAANSRPYYDLTYLNTYNRVDPSFATGQQIVDAGRAFFTNASFVDVTKFGSFHHNQLFCVAPITRGDPKSGVHDFWVAGVDCCSADNFHCGNAGSGSSHWGIRRVQDDEREFFHLAVQQAAAKHNLAAPHPLFFDWVADPEEHVNSYFWRTWNNYFLAIGLHFTFNLVCVLMATVLFSLIGKREARPIE